MSITEDNVIILNDEGKRVETRWYVTRPFNQDVYGVYVIRYTYKIEDGFASSVCDREYLGDSGHWFQYGEGEEIGCAMKIPGFLVHAMVRAGVFETAFVEDALKGLANKVFAGAVKSGFMRELEEDEDAT